MKDSDVKRREFIAGMAAAGSILLQPSWASQLLAAEAPVALGVKTVYVVWKCHLDIGFTAPAHDVIQRYFEVYLPQAMDLAEEIRRDGKGARFTWTTGSWLIYEYLEKSAPAQRARMERAIEIGDIAWHAMPHSIQSELLSPDLLRSALQISAQLDRRFNKKTTGAKMTDVPGHSIGLVGPLAQAGVRFLDIGVNPGSTTPSTPPLFLWRDANGAEIAVMNHSGYGQTMVIPQTDFAVTIEVWGDNGGVPSVQQFHDFLAELRQKHPGAQIKMSSLSEVANAMEVVRHQLPVLTQEIGDTWIHGVPSDPIMMARYRELCRLHSQWLRSGRIDQGDRVDLAFTRQLSLVPEHTWGLDVKTFLKDYEIYERPDFEKARHHSNFRQMEASWAEKRQRVDEAIETLPLPLQNEAALRLKALHPVWPTRLKSRGQAVAQPFETPHFSLQIDTQTGALQRLRDKKSGRDWATRAHPLGLVAYQTFGHSDYERFLQAYCPIPNEWWAMSDFGKPGIEKTHAQSRTRLGKLLSSSSERTGKGWRFLNELMITAVNDEKEIEGAPHRLTMEMFFPDATPDVQFTLQWFDKPAYRLPESLWFSFLPLAPQVRGWELDKMGQTVSPLNVVENGNRQLHAVQKGVSYRDEKGGLEIETLDAPIVSMGERTLLAFNTNQPDLNGGVHFNLFNNVWGTNYRMWFEEDMKFRFVLSARSF